MNATPEPTPAGPVTLGRVRLSEKHVAALAALAPFGLLILGVVAVAVLAGKRGSIPPASTTDTPPPPPPAPEPARPDPARKCESEKVSEAAPAPAPSPEPTIAAASAAG